MIHDLPEDNGCRGCKLEAEIERLLYRVKELEKANSLGGWNRDQILPVILDPGEYVCRDAACSWCGGDGKANSDFHSEKISCRNCNGTGLVPERVG